MVGVKQIELTLNCQFELFYPDLCYFPDYA